MNDRSRSFLHEGGMIGSEGILKDDVSLSVSISRLDVKHLRTLHYFTNVKVQVCMDLRNNWNWGLGCHTLSAFNL